MDSELRQLVNKLTFIYGKEIDGNTKKIIKNINRRLEVLEIIKDKKVDIRILEHCDCAKTYNDMGYIKISDKEFDLVKEEIEL